MWSTLELVLQWSKYQRVTSSMLQYFVSNLFLFWEEEEKKAVEQNLSLLSKLELICDVISGITLHSASFVFPFGYLTATDVILLISYSKKEKMFNQPHNFTFLWNIICCFSCCCFHLKQGKPKLCCTCAPRGKSVRGKCSIQFPVCKSLKCWAVT